MANEKRLIDANALQEHIGDCYGYPAVDILHEIAIFPTVDAVEVVRCKDCKSCEMCYPEKQLDKEATQAWLCKRYKRWKKPDDFCSYGERKNKNLGGKQ